LIAHDSDPTLIESVPYQATSSIDARHFEPNITVQLLLVDRFHEKLIHQAKFIDPNLASLGEINKCLMQVNLDSCIEISIVPFYFTHQS